MPDHCHMLVRIRPSTAPSEIMQKVKSNSSSWINNNNFLTTRFNWQNGGGIFSVSYRNVPKLVEYIEKQKEHHNRSTFKREYLKLLKHYGVEYEEKYLLEFFT